MMIIGQRDPVLEYEKLLEQTQNSEVDVRIFPDGHMSHIENKDELIDSLSDFIKT
jgi:hypothetical protein